VKAVNALRCMVNSFGANTWTLLAAFYEIGSFIGQKEMLDTYLNLGYGYVCTCLADAVGIKSTMGASEESSAIFSSCSESGANAKIDAGDEKEAKEQAKKDAAAKSIRDLAIKKVNEDTLKAMKGLAGCDALGTPEGLDTCYNNLVTYSSDANRALAFRELAVANKGGEAGTKNNTEKKNREQAQWLADAVVKGLTKMSGDLGGRVTSAGAFEPTCQTFNADGTLQTHYTKATCDVQMETFLTNASVNGTRPVKAGTELTCLPVAGESVGDGVCGAKDLPNGYVVGVLNATITCAGLSGNLVGQENCFFDWQHNRGWLDRKQYFNVDTPAMRTLGDKVGDKGNVKDSDVRCYAADNRTILNGATNCMPYPLDGQKVLNIDQFLWLSMENVSCENIIEETTEKGLENCKVDEETPCNQKRRENVKAGPNGRICVPTFTWKKK